MPVKSTREPNKKAFGVSMSTATGLLLVGASENILPLLIASLIFFAFALVALFGINTK